MLEELGLVCRTRPEGDIYPEVRLNDLPLAEDNRAVVDIHTGLAGVEDSSPAAGHRNNPRRAGRAGRTDKDQT